MRCWTRTVAVLVLAGCVAACGGPQTAEHGTAEASPAHEASPGQSRPAAYVQCISCHSVEPGRNGVGPSLHRIVGSKAASVPGYNYSPALKQSGLTWDEATLDAWLAAPAKLVPGNKMAYFGQPDPAKRKAIIDYLKAQN
jgi:cytochrome c